MTVNSAGDWRALTEHYRSMQDEELIELAADFDSLTPTAQQVLRDEMRLRKLPGPQAPHWAQATQGAIPAHQETTIGSTRFGFSLIGRTPDLVSAEPVEKPPVGASVEYTWKTPLCNCASDEQAWQISEVLRRSGIESWVEGAATYANSSGSQDMTMDDGNRRIVVAADQLDGARAIVAQPIPPEIVEQSKMAPPVYEPPICPRCGAEDPLLEGVDPVNAWKCETCGAEWTDEPDESAEQGTSRG